MLPPPGFTPTPIIQDVAATPTSLLLAAITSVLSTPTDSPSIYAKPSENGECSLLGPFAIFVQGALGCFALLALVYKRWRERPQRPFQIWFFDVSKQVVGSVLVHVANLGMSLLSSGQLSIKVDASTVATGRRWIVRGAVQGLQLVGRESMNFVEVEKNNGKYTPNPCSFYLLNLAIDTTIGIPILILLLRILTSLFALTPIGQPRQSIQSGNYGSPPQTWWWFKQSIIYFIGLMGMKICVLIIFLALPWISKVGDWALRWTEGDEALQVIFVMLVFPVIMNATQYYIIDSFIKNQNPEHEFLPDEVEDEEDSYADPHSGSSDDVHSGDEEDPELKAKEQEVRVQHKGKGSGSSAAKPKGLKTGGEYDPMFDGEDSPSTVVGSASSGEHVKGVENQRPI